MRSKEKKLKMHFVLTVLMIYNKLTEKRRSKTIFCLMGLYSSRTRVPYEPEEFNTYITNTDARQLAIPDGGVDEYYKLYNWTPEESTAYHQKKLDWAAIYANYTDPTKVNSIVREQVTNFINAFHPFSEKYIGKVKSSTASAEEDAAIFNYKFIRSPRHIRTTKIEEECYALIANSGTCALKGKARTAADASRSSILNGASGVEVAINVLWRIGSPELTGIPKMVPDSTWRYEQFSRSIFDLAFEAEDSGAVVQICCRWFILGKPQFAGPWTEAVQIRVL